MNLRILSSAEQEFGEAVDYYNAQRPGLGFEFAAEVKTVLGRVCAFPDAWPLMSRRARRCAVSRFPYGVLYQVRGDDLVVFAIMDLRRDPKTWRQRLKTT